MRVNESELLLGALLLGFANVALSADEERPELCRMPPRLIVSNYLEYPDSTARPPVGTVAIEVTVATDGTVRDVLIVGPAEHRLKQWALEASKHLKFEPVGKACRARLTLESRISE